MRWGADGKLPEQGTPAEKVVPDKVVPPQPKVEPTPPVATQPEASPAEPTTTEPEAINHSKANEHGLFPPPACLLTNQNDFNKITIYRK